MRNLFENDFVSHYQITPRNLVADEYEVHTDPFELVDSAASPIANEGDGILKMHNVEGNERGIDDLNNNDCSTDLGH